MGVTYISISLWEVYDVFINKRNLEKPVRINWAKILFSFIHFEFYNLPKLPDHKNLEFRNFTKSWTFRKSGRNCQLPTKYLVLLFQSTDI